MLRNNNDNKTYELPDLCLIVMASIHLVCKLPISASSEENARRSSNDALLHLIFAVNRITHLMETLQHFPNSMFLLNCVLED
ncbi:hypothetical protein TNCT_622401 [Trichonephila clavata]|uniref:Uncharacterized protein n=1 Tax=Trichonephila clavata TaxID=2740835 RepID=A0A8X6L2I1_TRICU|nr:hypothetical protein TNCT_622401 [Trichonephila clavata]